MLCVALHLYTQQVIVLDLSSYINLADVEE